MSNVTREEIIGLLKVAECPASCDNGVVVRDQLHGEIEQCQFCFEREQAIAALQAATPVAEVIHNFVGVDIAWCDPPSSGRPPAGTKLFTLPCPPAKAKAPEGWNISRTDGGEIIVQKSHVAGFVASEQSGGIAESTLYYLADDLLTAREK